MPKKSKQPLSCNYACDKYQGIDEQGYVICSYNLSLPEERQKALESDQPCLFGFISDHAQRQPKCIDDDFEDELSDEELASMAWESPLEVLFGRKSD